LVAKELTGILALTRRRNRGVLQINDDQVLIRRCTAAELAKGAKAEESKDLLGSVLAQRQNFLEAGVIKHERLLCKVYVRRHWFSQKRGVLGAMEFPYSP